MTLLEAKNLGCSVSNRSLLSGLSIKVERGQCWGILGPNGSGKTTLLHTLAGLTQPRSGEVLLQGRPISQLPRRTIARQCSLMLQENHDPFPASVTATVLSGRHPYLGRWQAESDIDRQMAIEALEQVELEALESRQVQTLSGGERRRLAFATQLTQNAPLMLLDEPLNHLDLRHQQLVLRAIERLRTEQHGIMMVLHDPNHAARCCDHLLLMHGGGEWQAGDTEALLTPSTLSRLYRCDIKSVHHNGQPWFQPG